jgi:hypothetical protein
VQGVKQVVFGKVRTKRSETRFSIIGKGFAYGHWFLGTHGRCEWLVGCGQVPLRKPEDPDFYKRSTTVLAKLLASKPVNVTLFLDVIPGSSNPVWFDNTVKAVACVSQAKMRRGSKMLKGWKIKMESKRHNKVGGVMDGRFYLGVGLREGQMDWTWSPETKSVINVLAQVVDPTIGGRISEVVDKANESLKNTSWGLLDWKARFGLVTGRNGGYLEGNCVTVWIFPR